MKKANEIKILIGSDSLKFWEDFEKQINNFKKEKNIELFGKNHIWNKKDC